MAALGSIGTKSGIAAVAYVAAVNGGHKGLWGGYPGTNFKSQGAYGGGISLISKT